MNAEFEFHSVGQGLFYSGCVGEDGNAFRFVYDCGGRKSFIEHEVNSYIGKLAGKGLDLIVLSHLHEDHINGVMDLLTRIRDSGVSDLPRVVMPYSNGSMNLLYDVYNAI